MMTLCTRSSFWYPFNNWDDVNSYFTVGKSMFRGLVPYKDLFDQKGVFLYFLYGLASLFSYTTFHGVFVLEVIACALTLLAQMKIALLYLPRGTVFLMTPLCGAILYSSFLYFRTVYPEPVPYRTMFLGGVLSSFVFLIKFNSLGFFIGWVLMLLLANLFAYRQVIGVLRRIQITMYSLLVFGAGFLVPIVPFFLYFLIHGALYDWIYVYLYCNLFVYSVKMSLGARFLLLGKVLYRQFFLNPLPGLFALAGVLLFLFRKDTKGIEKINLLLLGVGLLLGIFIGGIALPYYILPLGTFVVLVEMAASLFLPKKQEFLPRKPQKRGPAFYHISPALKLLSFYGALFSSLLGMLLLCFSLTQNRAYHSLKKGDLWQTHFTEYIRKSGVKAPTLLNVNCFDQGLYTVSGILPTVYFFQTQTIHLDEVYEVQMGAIRSGRTDFILSMDGAPDNIFLHYDLVLKEEDKLPGTGHTLFLFQKIKE
ncbi:MAG: hypothetical protein HXK90_06045 [Lachnospiraceae bacterium]|nr:hypothetical protein [Lachnospiraceae bacterium]